MWAGQGKPFKFKVYNDDGEIAIIEAYSYNEAESKAKKQFKNPGMPKLIEDDETIKRLTKISMARAKANKGAYRIAEPFTILKTYNNNPKASMGPYNVADLLPIPVRLEFFKDLDMQDEIEELLQQTGNSPRNESRQNESSKDTMNSNFNKTRSLSEFVNYYGSLLASGKLPSDKIKNLRQRFVDYFTDDSLAEYNDLDDPVVGERNFIPYLNKYFVTPEILKSTVSGWSSWSQVPINDKFVTPEFIKDLLSAWDNGRGGDYSMALHYVDGKKITPEIIDFITSLSSYQNDELSQILDAVEGLPTETVNRINQIISGEQGVTEEINRLIKLSNIK